MATMFISPEEEDYEEEEEEEEQAGVWDDWQSDEEDSSSDYLCLFCDSRYDSIERLFEHCTFVHSFDFGGIIRDLRLDFYGSFKLINYIRSQVATNKCWLCDLSFKSNTDLQNHQHTADNIEKDGKFPWDDELYLKPFMIDDALLHSFVNDEDEEDLDPPVIKEDIPSELKNNGEIAEICYSSHDILDAEELKTSGARLDIRRHVAADSIEKSRSNGICEGIGNGESSRKRKDCQLTVSFANVVAREIKNVNESYFGSYGSFGIHKEMISDKVRTEAYRIAILNNPSLLNQAIVMDVGCGTGILRLAKPPPVLPGKRVRCSPRGDAEPAGPVPAAEWKAGSSSFVPDVCNPSSAAYEVGIPCASADLQSALEGQSDARLSYAVMTAAAMNWQTSRNLVHRFEERARSDGRSAAEVDQLRKQLEEEKGHRAAIVEKTLKQSNEINFWKNQSATLTSTVERLEKELAAAKAAVETVRDSDEYIDEMADCVDRGQRMILGVLADHGVILESQRAYDVFAAAFPPK